MSRVVWQVVSIDVRTVPLFLILQRRCGDAHSAVAVRVPQLLARSALIISERCHPTDEAMYEGMVDFVT